ncbi:hypothetical protein AAFN86_22835 [Roseomonas sp. CAU 1739]|uniref:hypothetical protein n=1 Tax=Roseomonas sp. CAU 1739 TaxID=3140364 RepID=UPI00325BF2D8
MDLYPGRHLRGEDEPITMTDLAVVIPGNWSLRHRRGDPQVAAWHPEFLALLLAESGTDWEDGIGPEARDLGLPRMGARLPRMYAAIRRPMDGIYEHTPRRGEKAALDAFLRKVEAATEALQATWHELLRELLLLRWPKAR